MQLKLNCKSRYSGSPHQLETDYSKKRLVRQRKKKSEYYFLHISFDVRTRIRVGRKRRRYRRKMCFRICFTFTRVCHRFWTEKRRCEVIFHFQTFPTVDWYGFTLRIAQLVVEFLLITGGQINHRLSFAVSRRDNAIMNL